MFRNFESLTQWRSLTWINTSLNIKLEQIKKLAAKKEYKQAADIAKEMNWNKIKDWSTLATIINVQEAAGDYEEARDMAILAITVILVEESLYISLQSFL